MSDLNVQLVREFFELNSFRVMTHWQQDHSRARAPERGLQLFVENADPSPAGPPEFLLGVNHVSMLERAIVEVRAWHAERMYVSQIENNTVLFEVATEQSLELGRNFFGSDEFSTVLVIGELPASPEPRAKSIAALKEGKVSHIIEFHTILFELLDKINPNVSYASSATLQILRLLKRYNFVRRQQLELPFPTDAPVASSGVQMAPADEQEYAGPDYVIDLD